MFTQNELKLSCDEVVHKLHIAASSENFSCLPFKHIVVDNILPHNLLDSVHTNFPKIDEVIWEKTADQDIEVKYRSKWKSEFDIPEGIVDVVRILNSAPFLHAMSEIFEIEKIVPDNYFTGGGLNVTTRGGLLDVHVDGNYHDATGLNRRLNALIYLNRGWQESWGGHFGLYDETGQTCLKKVAPLDNRLVIFDSHDKSFHGLPDPLNFPEGSERKSILLYYYTKEERPSEQVAVCDPHSALWVKRNLLDKRGNKTREFY